VYICFLCTYIAKHVVCIYLDMVVVPTDESSRRHVTRMVWYLKRFMLQHRSVAMYIYKHEYLCWPTANGAPQEDLVLVLQCRDTSFVHPLL